MKVEDLKIALQYAQNDSEVTIAVKLPFATVGAMPMVAVKSANQGFDWESGKFILTPSQVLTYAERDFDAQFKEVQKKNGWLEYEKANLQAEVKRLRKVIDDAGLRARGPRNDHSGSL